MYTITSPEPNPRGGGQLPDPKSAILRLQVQRGRAANH